MSIVRKLRYQLNRARGYATVGGIKLPLDPAVISPRMARAFAKQTYEMREAAMARRVVEAGDIVLELGAGIGFISSFLRRHTTAGAIVSVEANPDLIGLIDATHRRNAIANVTVLMGIVAPRAQPGQTAAFYRRADFWASSLAPDPAPVVDTVEVPVLALPDVLARYRPAVLIMDIEGGELDLFEARDLAPVQKIMLEVHPDLYGLAGMDRLLQSLSRLGFALDAEISGESVLALRRIARLDHGSAATR